MSTLEQVKPAPIRTSEGGMHGIRSWWGNTRSFVAEVRNETRRVTWPTRREVYATTVVVILFSAAAGMYLWGLDLAFDRIVNWIFRQFGA